MADGTNVEAITLGSSEGLQAEILTLAGTLRSLTLPVGGQRLPLVLPLHDLAAYLADTMYVGQIVGRYANRIDGAAFELDGTIHRLTANEGRNTLHGGRTGFGRQVWKLLNAGDGGNDFLELAHHSPAGEDGFPGNLDVTARITVHENTLTLGFEALTDADTPINFTWHPYFNLSGDFGTPIAEHRLRLEARHYLPALPTWLPAGTIEPVAGTVFDFREFRPLASAHPINNYWVIDENAELAAELSSPESGVRMKVRTNLPGLQVYDGFALRDQHAGKHAVCLEPGNFPNAPNQRNFPSPVLRPGETHRSFMSFSFSGR